jgi:hypothetical protein
MTRVTTLLGANIHAAAAFGSREYPRSNPPSHEQADNETQAAVDASKDQGRPAW